MHNVRGWIVVHEYQLCWWIHAGLCGQMYLGIQINQWRLTSGCRIWNPMRNERFRCRKISFGIGLVNTRILFLYTEFNAVDSNCWEERVHVDVAGCFTYLSGKVLTPVLRCRAYEAAKQRQEFFFKMSNKRGRLFLKADSRDVHANAELVQSGFDKTVCFSCDRISLASFQLIKTGFNCWSGSLPDDFEAPRVSNLAKRSAGILTVETFTTSRTISAFRWREKQKGAGNSAEQVSFWESWQICERKGSRRLKFWKKREFLVESFIWCHQTKVLTLERKGSTRSNAFCALCRKAARRLRGWRRTSLGVMTEG